MDLTTLSVSKAARPSLSADELIEACTFSGLVAWCSPAQWGALSPELRMWERLRKAGCQHTTFRPQEPQLPCPHPECWKQGRLLRVMHPSPFSDLLEPSIDDVVPVDQYELNQLGVGRKRFYAWRKK